VETTAEQSCAATHNGSYVPDGGTGNPEVDDAARTAGRLGDRPLIVLTAGQTFIPPDPRAKQEASEFHDIWIHQLQPQLAALSTRGRQIVVANSGHAINFEAPDEVVHAVRDVLEQLRTAKSH
jgi:pimeloyl-ACP methyl ester carboxylesterase